MLAVQVARVFQKRRASLRPAPPVAFCLTPDSPRSTSRPCLLLTHNPHLCTIILKMQLPLIRCHIHSQLYQSVFLWDNFLTGRKSSFHSAMAETSGSGVPSTKTLSHRGAVLPFLLAGSRWKLVSATTVCINSTFDLLDTRKFP